MVRLANNRQSRKAIPEAPQPWQASAAERQRLDELLDEALKQTFPASDPVAIVQQAPERPKTETPAASAPFANHGGSDRAA